jgi:putative ABC transport system permease protein
MRDVRPAAFLLVAAVTLVLLIACANLAGLFLARSSTRQRELAVRLALGAGRWRIARLMLTESLVLAAAGGAVGLALAWVALRGTPALIPAQFRAFGLEATVSTRVLMWSLATALAAGVLVGIFPALQASRSDPQESLKADARAGGARGGRRFRHALVAAELALSVLLLFGATLFVRSMLNIHRLDPGFDAGNVLTMRLTLPRDRYPGAAAGAFFERLSERLGSLPGVRAVSASSQFPPAETFSTQVAIEHASDASLASTVITVATPAYFDTLRVPLLSGRTFSNDDRLDSPPVAVVNRAFVARFIADGDPVGRRIRLGSADRPSPWVTIVGVVADYRNSGLTQPVRPEVVTPVRQQTEWNQLFVLVRSASDAAALLPTVRQAVTALDADQPVYLSQTLEEAMAASVFQQRISTLLLSALSALALVLAAVGVYGVMSYAVAARTQEIGVRLAIGAQRRDVVWLVIRQVLGLTAAGLAIGIGALVAAGGLIEGLLFGVRPIDPITIAVVSIVLSLVALAAAWSPAARASRVDPIEALRYE